jgi:hypothetical protein
MPLRLGRTGPRAPRRRDACFRNTCAGMIVLAQRVQGGAPLFAAMDITVQRNAYGRQVDSFETDVEVRGIDHRVRGVFIRAPRVTRWDPTSRSWRSTGALRWCCEQDNLLVASFHPELVGETGLHRYLSSRRSETNRGALDVRSLQVGDDQTEEGSHRLPSFEHVREAAARRGGRGARGRGQRRGQHDARLGRGEGQELLRPGGQHRPSHQAGYGRAERTARATKSCSTRAMRPAASRC